MTVETVALAAAGLLAAVVLAVWLLSRRNVVRRLSSVVARLEGGSPEVEGSGGLERALARLERTANAAAGRAGEAAADGERLAQALGAIATGVVVCDEAGAIRYRNATAERLVGARHGEALVERTLEEQLGEALAGGAPVRTIELFGPPRRQLVLSARALDDGWRTIGAVAVIEDVTERRRLEAVRRDFVANISHELKTPVGALALLAETMADEDEPAVARRLAARMQSEAQRVARILDDLLDLSRIEAEEAPVREPVPVHLVVAQAVERVRGLADQRGIELDVAEAPSRVQVLGDRRQLVSALYNLLENAVKYSDAGSPVELRVATDGSAVELVVRDGGIGIPTRDHERVFERFYRVDRARSRDTGGTGLGLAIVRHVATNHGGEVHVDSREGEGSTFTLRLPAGPGPVAVSAPAEAG